MYKPQSITRALTGIGAFLIVAAAARADFTPIPLAPGSLTHDAVVESTSLPPLSMATTATTDAGTNNSGNTWYQIGYNTNNLTTGLPMPGGTVADTNGGNHNFTMASSYAGNCAIMVGHHGGTGTPVVTNATLTFSAPAAYTHLSFMNSAGNGAVPVSYVIHYADASTEAGGPFSARDWFATGAADNTAVAYNPAGRISISGGGFANVGSQNGTRIFFADVAVGTPGVNITKVEFIYAGNPYNNGRAFIFAVSGSTDGGTVFNPITVTGYNYDPVVEVGGPTNAPLATTTVTMDNGTNNTGNTWYERGYYSRFPNSGLPLSGSTFTSISMSNVQYTLASYTGNNVAILDSSNITANITLATPATYGGLSFLVSGVNGATTLRCVLQYQDGTAETNAMVTTDWFTTAPSAWGSFGRVNRDNRSVNNTPDQVVNPPLDIRSVINPNPRLIDSVVAVGNPASAITNVLLIRTNAGGTQRALVFAVSGAPVGNLPTYVSTQPSGVKTNEGTSVTLSAVIGGTSPISYQWKRAPKGGGINNIFDFSTFANVTDGGTTWGATTSQLVITNVTTAHSADYVLIASNPYGAATSSVVTVTILSTNPVITLPTDPISIYAPNGGTTPVNETVQRSIDQRTFKYLNFGSFNGAVAAFGGPVGFVVTPQSGSSIVTSLRFASANDAQGRDPSDYTLEGSNDDGANWTVITSGTLLGTRAIPTARNPGDVPLNIITHAVQEVDFANASGYKSYRVSFANVYTPNNVNSMQIGEVELIGTLVPNPPVFTRVPPTTVTVYVGGSATFSAAAAGYPPPSFRWNSNGVPILNATNASYTFANAQLSDSGRTFSCTASNVFPPTVTTPTTTLIVIPAPTEPYPAAVLASAPISFWRLNEGPDDGSGNNGVQANDYRGGRTGTYNASEIQQPGYNPVVDLDSSARFGILAASDCYVGGINDLSFAAPSNTTVNFTVEAWAKGLAQVTDAGIVTKGIGSGGEQFTLDTGGPNRGFRFFFRDANGGTHGASSSIALDGEWHHVVGVSDQANSSVSLYVDGRLVATGASAPLIGVLSSLNPVTIGARQPFAGSYANQFVGTIDDVAIYNYALTPSQITNHYYSAQLPPYIVSAPTNTTVNEGMTAFFYSSASGAPPLGYQWYDVTGGDPGVLMPGQTSSNLALAGVTASQNGNLYRVVVTNSYGSVTSPPTAGSAAQLTVLSGAPNLLTDIPSTLLVYAGRTATFAVNVGGTEPITYQWKSNGVNLVNGGRIVGANSNVLTIANAQVADTTSYQLQIQNNQGGPIFSTSCALVVQAVPMLNDGALGWGTNGTPSVATIVGDVLTLSTGAGSTARSAFYNYPLYIGAFTASYTYQDVGGGGADGVVFVLHNDARGATAMGGPGGALGYGGITPSVGLLFNIFGTAGIAFRTNGVTGAPYAATTPVNVASGDPIDVTIRYAAGLVQVTLSNTVSAATFGTTYPVGNLSTLVGGDTDYVGFTGSDGGIVSTQTISKFKFIPHAVLSANPSGPGSVTLSWLASIGGYGVQSTNSLGAPTSWFNLNTTINQVGNQNQVIVSPANGNQFYRLMLPVP